MDDGAEPVRDDEDGPAAGGGHDGLLDVALRGAVQRARGLVIQHDGRASHLIGQIGSVLSCDWSN